MKRETKTYLSMLLCTRLTESKQQIFFKILARCSMIIYDKKKCPMTKVDDFLEILQVTFGNICNYLRKIPFRNKCFK